MYKAFLKHLFLLLILEAGNMCLDGQSVETVIQTGHYGPVTSVCYSNDGKLVATGSEDKTVKLWRRSDGKEIRTYQGSPSEITKLQINKQGNAILSVNQSGSVIIWDLHTGKQITSLRSDTIRFTSAAFSPDGLKFVTGSRKSYISVWETASGKKLSDIRAIPQNLYSENGFDYPEAESVMFSADGKFILAGVADYTAILWDAETRKELRKYKRSKSTCSSCITEAIITPDNKLIISACSDSLKVFDRESGTLVKEVYGQGGTAESLSVSADGRFIAGFEYGVAEVWDLKSWKLVSKSGDYSERRVLSVALSPDGKELLAGNEKRTADLILVENGNLISTLKGYLNQVDESILTDPYMYWAAMVNEAKLSPDGKYIAVGRTGNNAKLLDFNTGRVFRTLRGHSRMVISLCFSKDGKYLATGGLDGKAIVWDVESGVPVRTVRFPDEKNAIYSVDISTDNKYLATADWGGLVVIWDIATGKSIRAVSPHDKTGCYQVKLLPNNVYFLSAGLDRRLKLTEIDTGEEIRDFIGHTDLVNSISLNADGKSFISTSRDGTLRLWDISSGLQTRKITAHQGGAYSARYFESINGRFIISGGDDSMIRLWNADTGELVSEYAGHQGAVGDVNITPDRKYIISGSRDGSVRFWDTQGKKEIVSVVFINENDWFIRNPAGYFDASNGAYSSISFVNGTEIYNPDQFFNEFYRPGLFSQMLSGNEGSFRQTINQAVVKYPPPSVEFILPEKDSKTDSPVSAFMVSVTNNGGGVKEFRVMQNGKRQNIDYKDLTGMTKAGQNAMKTFDLNLIPGNNEVTVTALSNGDIESSPVSTMVYFNGTPKNANCYVLSIGINKYENSNLNLTYASPDARALSDFLKSKGSKLFNEIIVKTITDGDATKANIISAIDQIGKTIRKEDIFIFFYAGHGSTAGDLFYFITTEIPGLYQQEKLKSALSVTELQEKFRQIGALKQVIFIDACESGGSVEALAMRGASEEKALAQLSRSSGVHVMASSEKDQTSAEIKSLGHGVFTYALLEALNGKADGAPADSKVTIYEIKSFLDDQVPEISYNLIRHKQFPSTFSIGHDFPIVME